jgi:2-dehydropantoate 2-reductase
MKILAMGAGGVGGYFGARLAQAGNEVVFIARGAHLEALKRTGLTLKSALGDAHLQVRSCEDPAEAGTADAVLFAVKLWDTEAAAGRLRPVVGASTVVIPFQNGVESIDRLKRILPEASVMGGSAYIATRIAAPGLIEHTGDFARLIFGPVLASQRPAADAFLAACRAAGVEAQLSEDIVRVNWEKFVFLVGISTACAAARWPVDKVRADPDLRRLMRDVMRETWRLGRSRGVALAEDFVETQMALADSFPPGMRPSLLHDLEAGGRLEAPWLCGAVARLSEQAGIEAPANRAIYAELNPYLDGSQVKAA